ncbi:helix-turn-helix domain-containing protein [Xylophilus sp. GOD-11R]|uniref:helix-turn-helix domain-containing protein n=1 Tax=Xylophilus sp. GOD-11R TaxID=3089814 RepID=UPI00298D5DEB|nr:helix-turn-helix domain-containing protein [Xylophilus sp. GOD-11R]WPB57362.1 helix-turn-helix domain-containing protein [Xylophilus sp. GOD-11R]
MSAAAPLVEELLADLIGLLNHGAPAEEFSRRLARAEALPDAARRSSAVEWVRMAMAVRNRLEMQQQRERGMLAVSESAQDLSSRLDLNGLLHAIVVRARNLLGAHLAWLSIYDTDTAEFRAVATDGAIARGTPRMTAPRDLGVAGVVMSNRMPFTTPNYLNDTRFTHDPALDDTFRAEGINALVGVPLMWDGEVIGLLFVADRYHRTHDALSVSILQTLATHGAVAIRNARAFADATAALRHAESARAELERHTRSIQMAAEAHEQLTTLLARGAPLASLCDSVAGLLNGSVLVLDEASQVIGRGTAAGYAGSASAGYEPHGAHNEAIRQALHASRISGRSVEAYRVGEEVCRVVAVIGGDDVLGAILLFRWQAVDELSARTLERSASVIGVVLLSQERMEATRTRDASALMRNLLSSRQDAPGVLRDRAAHFDLQIDQPISLVLVQWDAVQAGYVARRLRAEMPLAGALVDEVDGLVVVLCPTTRVADVARDLSALGLRAFGGRFRGIQSRPARAVGELPGIHAALRRAMEVLGRIGGQGRIVPQSEMALYSALFETQDRAGLDGFLDATIGPLIAVDRKKGSELVGTLLRYFEKGQNARETALALGIHVNTVRQRLASVEEVLGPLTNATRGLEVHMALRVWGLGRGINSQSE